MPRKNKAAQKKGAQEKVAQEKVEQEKGAQGTQIKDAEVIKCILKDAGVKDYEPRAVEQLMSVVYNSAVDVLLKAKRNAEMKRSATIEVEDIKLAIAEEASNRCKPPTNETLQEIAAKCNEKPLPKIDGKRTLHLPPLSDCLLNENYGMIKPQPNKGGLDHGMTPSRSDATANSTIPKPNSAKVQALPAAKQTIVKPPNMTMTLPAGAQIAVKASNMTLGAGSQLAVKEPNMKPIISQVQALPVAKQTIAKPPNMTLGNFLPAGSQCAVKEPNLKPIYTKVQALPVAKPIIVKPPNMAKTMPAGAQIAVNEPNMTLAKPIAKGHSFIVTKPLNMTLANLTAESHFAVKEPNMKPILTKVQALPVAKQIITKAPNMTRANLLPAGSLFVVKAPPAATQIGAKAPIPKLEKPDVAVAPNSMKIPNIIIAKQRITKAESLSAVTDVAVEEPISSNDQSLATAAAATQKAVKPKDRKYRRHR